MVLTRTFTDGSTRPESPADHAAGSWARLAYENQRPDVTFFNQELESLQAPVLNYPQPDLLVTLNNYVEARIVSYPAATYFELNNTLPNGLSFNPATGVISGTVTVAFEDLRIKVVASMPG